MLLYFSYENSQLDRQSRAVLYKNVLEHVDPESSLYQKYEREMEQFAMEELFAGRIDSCLAVIYKHMIYQTLLIQTFLLGLDSFQDKVHNDHLDYMLLY